MLQVTLISKMIEMQYFLVSNVYQFHGLMAYLWHQNPRFPHICEIMAICWLWGEGRGPDCIEMACTAFTGLQIRVWVSQKNSGPPRPVR